MLRQCRSFHDQPFAMKNALIILFLITSICSLPFCKKGSDISSLYGDTSRTIYTSTAGNARAIALDGNGNLYTTDNVHNKVFKVKPDGTVTVFAGTGEFGYADGAAATAMFYGLSGIAVNSHGDVYVSDLEYSKIRKITAAGIVSTIGTARAYNICIDKNDVLYIADFDRNIVSTMTDDGTETIIAGRPFYTGYQNGLPEEARFTLMRGIGVDPSGNIYVVDGQARIRKIEASTHIVSTFVGDHLAEGLHDGDPSHATFGELRGITFDGAGNMIVGDAYYNRFRKITPEGFTTTFPDIYYGASDAKVRSDGSIIAACEQNANIYLIKVKK